MAPDQERSAAGHSLTLHHPLRAKLIGPQRWSVDGTPTDCVNWGVLHLLKDERPKLLFSGINLGLNLGDDVTYSGTVSAAFEGTLIGITSVAISQEIETGFTFDAAATFAASLARVLLEHPLKPGNADQRERSRGAAARGARGPPGPAPLRRGGDRKDRSARPSLLLDRRDAAGGDARAGTDLSAVDENYISVTPLHLDLTHYDSLSLVEGIAAPMQEAEAAKPR